MNRDALELIRERTDIVALISQYVKLIKKGRVYLGLCPFHKEKTPSFNVSPEKKTYHCFGCGERGDVYDFMMRHESLSFSEALMFLAEKAHISIPKYEKKIETTLNETMDEICSYYQSQLQGAPREYLRSRGVNEESIQNFKIGYSKGENLRKIIRHSDDLEKTGILDHYGRDRFRERIIFPINQTDGTLLAFGGRIIQKSDLPKYINSPESKLFRKREVLFGLYQAKKEITKTGIAIVVEGYLDVIMLHQAGLKNVVAPLGTALTESQMKLVWNHAKEVVLLFDGDKSHNICSSREISRRFFFSAIKLG